MGDKNRHFGREFKRDAVQLVTEKGDVAGGIKSANELQPGTVWVNQHMNLVAETPWSGFKESGLGKEGGSSALGCTRSSSWSM